MTATITATITPPAAGIIDWEYLARRKFHTTRVRIIETLAQTDEPVSPKWLSEQLDERLGNVSYHVRALLDEELLELDRTEPRRGAVEHFYRLAPGVTVS